MTTAPTAARAWADAARRSAARARAVLDRAEPTRLEARPEVTRHAVATFHALAAAATAAHREETTSDLLAAPCARSWATLARLHADAAEALAEVTP